LQTCPGPLRVPPSPPTYSPPFQSCALPTGAPSLFSSLWTIRKTHFLAVFSATNHHDKDLLFFPATLTGDDSFFYPPFPVMNFSAFFQSLSAPPLGTFLLLDGFLEFLLLVPLLDVPGQFQFLTFLSCPPALVATKP